MSINKHDYNTCLRQKYTLLISAPYSISVGNKSRNYWVQHLSLSLFLTFLSHCRPALANTYDLISQQTSKSYMQSLIYVIMI